MPRTTAQQLVAAIGPPFKRPRQATPPSWLQRHHLLVTLFFFSPLPFLQQLPKAIAYLIRPLFAPSHCLGIAPTLFPPLEPVHTPVLTSTTMTGKGKSRWADSEEDAARTAALKKEKELKKRLKKEKEAAAAAARRAQEAHTDSKGKARETLTTEDETDEQDAAAERPAKRRRLTPEPPAAAASVVDGGKEGRETKILRLQGGGFGRARSVENYDKLNDIEEGAYGWVARARELATGKVVALKRLKIEPNDRNGLPVTGLREIQILKDCEHRNIVELKEVVVGEDTTRIEKYAYYFSLVSLVVSLSCFF